jgi:PAS domain S-box-containing protein
MKKTRSLPSLEHLRLQQIISALDEGVILLAPDGAIISANNAALAMHGVSTRAALGKSVADYTRRFALSYSNHRPVPKGQYPIARACAGKVFSDLVVRVSRAASDNYRMHCVRSLMLRDQENAIEYAVLVASDITERFDAEQRFEKAFQANPAPALICRLSDFRYTRANRGFLEMTGYGKSSIVGKTIYEFDVLAEAQDRLVALERLNQGDTIPQMEALLPLPRGRHKHVIVAGQPIEQDDERYMLFTFIDLDPSKLAEDSLRQTEERFKTAFRLAPVPMAVSTLEGERLVEVNDAFQAATGYLLADVDAVPMQSLPLWKPAERYAILQSQLRKTGSVRNFELQICARDGLLLDCLVSAEIVAIRDETCVLSVIQDITNRKHTEGELIAAIELVMQDSSWFSRSIIEKLAQLRRPASQSGSMTELADLTMREREVLGLMCEGLDNDDIGSRLGLSSNTVRNHVASIYSKLDVHSRSAAIVWGRERGIIGYQKPSATRG